MMNKKELKSELHKVLHSGLSMSTISAMIMQVIENIELNKKTVWVVKKFDLHFSYSSMELWGIFASREQALKELGYGTKSWKKDWYENGDTQ